MGTEEVYIVSACRTAIGSFNGQYSKVPATTLGTIVIKQCLERAGIPPNQISEVIMGQILTAGQGQNPARQSALNAGIPIQVPAYTINMLCGSGLKTVWLGYQAILTGDAKMVVCGGQENMTMAEHTSLLRNNVKLGSIEMKDSLYQDGLSDAFVNKKMGETAEHLAQTYKISRQNQDKFACNSQAKATKAQVEKYFEKEIVPVKIPRPPTSITKDEFVKPNTTFEKLSEMAPCFERDPAKGPSVTPGNASGINDGAAAVIVASKSQVQALNLTPLVKIVGFAQSGNEPIEMGIAPITAIENLFKKTGWSKDEVDLYEINEAFAVQSIIILDKLGLDYNKVNVTGGAIALGHPLGASGTRVLVTLIYNLQRLGLKKGVASLCIGGGMGIAIAVERV